MTGSLPADAAQERFSQLWGAGVSFVVHALVIGTFVFWGSGHAEPDRPIIVPEAVIKTQLVALGTRPKKALPVITRAPKAPRRKATHLGQTVDKDTGKKNKKRDKKQDKEEEEKPALTMDDILSDLKKRQHEGARVTTDRHGSKDGPAYGTSATGRLEAAYADKVKRLLQGYISYMGVSEDELAGMQATVYFEVNQEGKIRESKFVKRSGNQNVDDSVLRALRLFSVGGPRSFPGFPEGAGFGEVFRAETTFKPRR